MGEADGFCETFGRQIGAKNALLGQVVEKCIMSDNHAAALGEGFEHNDAKRLQP